MNYDAPYVFVTEVHEFHDMVRELTKYEQRGVGNIVALDTETTGLDPLTCDLLLVQLALPGKSWAIDARRVSHDLIGEYLHNKQFLGQNLLFDAKFLKYHTGAEIKVGGDTMIAEQILVSGTRESVSLVTLSKKYLGLDMEKETRSTFIGMKPDHAFTSAQLEYAVRDVQVLFEIDRQQRQLIMDNNLLITYRLERSVVPVVANMELNGIFVDQDSWRNMLKEAQPKRDVLALAINAAMGGQEQLNMFEPPKPTFDVNSNMKLLHGLRRLGIPVEDTKERTLLLYNDEQVVQDILSYRGLEKLITSFGDTLLAKINPHDQRLHCNLKQLGTDTGRFSSSGPNLQNLPNTTEFRALFTAMPGNVLVDADYSAQEMRVLAQLSKDPVLARVFEQKQDAHAATASLMFNVPVEEVTKAQRTVSKVLGFGLIYGRGARAMAEQLKIPQEESQQLLERYFTVYAGVARWLKERRAEVWNTHESRTIISRRRILLPPDPLEDDYNLKKGTMERRATNTPIQGSSGDMMKMAMVHIHHAFKNKPSTWKMLLTIHDELLIEVPEQDQEEASAIVHEKMVYAGKQLLPDVPVEAEVKAGRVWTH